jgi:PKD repeat protein
MSSRGVGVIVLVLLLAMSASIGFADGTQWNTQIKAYVGSVGGSPQDQNALIGVLPGATDGWDSGIDNKKPGKPFGEYVYTYFNRSSWGQGPIMGDYRSPIAEGTSKVWGTATLDTLNVEVRVTQDPSGVTDDCGIIGEYSVASAVYLTWTLGVGASFMPPSDYTFTLQYTGGINPKPAGTTPAGVSVPALNTTWNMKTVTNVAIPLWRDDFNPPTADCLDLRSADSARFKIIVFNPVDVTGPSCSITFDPPSPTVGQAIAFNGNVTGGTPAYTYAWSFGDGGTSTAATPTHTYGAANTYTVSLTVTDSAMLVGTCSTSVTVTAANQPPTCSITFAPASPKVGQSVTFNGNATDPDVGDTIASYAWTFGDGGTSTAAAPSHTYAAANTFTVNLTVTDNHGATGTCATSVTVVANQPPTCAISADPASPTTLDVVQFDGGAVDPDGTVVGWDWDFDDGGSSTAEAPSHQFDNGTWLVTLTVTDDLGDFGDCFLSLTVANVPPTCGITFTPLAPTVDDVIQFNSHATDPDGTVVSVSWDFGDLNTGSGLTTNHQYTLPNDYTVQATATDDDGGTGTCSTVVSVSPTVADSTPPLLSITSPAPAAVLTGSLSLGWLAATASDPDTGISQVQFYLDGAALGTPDTVAPYQAMAVDTTLYGNGTHYVGAVATNGDSLTTAMSYAVAFSNTVDPAAVPVIRQSVALTAVLPGPPRQIRVNLTTLNVGFSADNVTINDFVFVGSYPNGSGGLVLVNIPAHPTSGSDWPRNLGTLGTGASTTIELLSDPVPAQVTAVKRWMDNGTYTKTGVPTPVYTF